MNVPLACTILILEPDAQLRSMFKQALRQLGHQVVVTADPTEAIDKARQSQPQLALLDLRCSEDQNHVLVKRLSQAKTPVIVTAWASEPSNPESALRAGAVDCLKKPCSIVDLKTAVDKALKPGATPPPPSTVPTPTKGIAPLPAAPAPPVTAHDKELPPDYDYEVSYDGSPTLSMGQVVNQLAMGTLAVPNVPPIIAELRNLIHQPLAPVPQVAALLEKDPQLAARLVQLSNTTLYSRSGQKNTHIKSAVTRVGLRSIQTILETVFLQDCFRVTNKRCMTMLNRVWRHSLARAFSMRTIAEKSRAELRLDIDHAYLAGLLSDVGASFLIWHLDQSYRDRPTFDPSIYLTDLRDYHAAISGAVLAQWSLDPLTITVARTHHAEGAAKGQTPYYAVSVLGQELAGVLAEETDITWIRKPATSLTKECSEILGIGLAALGPEMEALRSEFDSVVLALV